MQKRGSIETTLSIKLILQVDVGNLKSGEEEKRNFELIIFVVYEPESLDKVGDKDISDVDRCRLSGE